MKGRKRGSTVLLSLLWIWNVLRVCAIVVELNTHLYRTVQWRVREQSSLASAVYHLWFPHPCITFVESSNYSAHSYENHRLSTTVIILSIRWHHRTRRATKLAIVTRWSGEKSSPRPNPSSHHRCLAYHYRIYQTEEIPKWHRRWTAKQPAICSKYVTPKPIHP